MVNSRTNEMGGIDAIVTALEELRGVVRELSARVSALEKSLRRRRSRHAR